MTRRKLHTAAILLAGAMTATACSSGNSTPAASSSASTNFAAPMGGTLKVSGYNPGDEVAKARSDLATTKVAPTKVTLDTANFDTQKFSAQVAAGQAPDLILTDRSLVGTLADKKLIIPLDACYQQFHVDAKQRFYSAPLADVTYDGHLYGVPQFFQASIILGNKFVMDAAGVKATDLDTSKPEGIIAAAKKMNKVTGGKESVLGFDGDIPGSAPAWVAVFGGKLNDANGKPTLDDPNVLKALEFMKQLMDAQGGYASVKSFKDSMDVFGDANQYVKNQVGAQTWAQWYVNVLANTKDKVKIVGVPLKTLAGKTLGYAGGTAWAIPAAGKNPAAACSFALNATSPEAWQAAGTARAQTVKEKNSINTGLFTGSPVADKAVREAFVKPSGSADFDQVIATTYAAIADGTTSFGASAVGQDITNALKTAVEQALTGEASPQNALAEAQATALRAWQQSNAGKKNG